MEERRREGIRARKTWRAGAIQFTILRQGGAHANLTLAKSFPVLQPRLTQVVDLYTRPWPDVIETRSATDKALKAYQTVIGEAASRGDGGRCGTNMENSPAGFEKFSTS